jgi:hypothetical protein
MAKGVVACLLQLIRMRLRMMQWGKARRYNGFMVIHDIGLIVIQVNIKVVFASGCIRLFYGS